MDKECSLMGYRSMSKEILRGCARPGLHLGPTMLIHPWQEGVCVLGGCLLPFTGIF